MEKKIEISEAAQNRIGNWECQIFVDGVNLIDSYGQSKEEAQQNARIAAKGYLVEEMVKRGDFLVSELISAMPIIKIPEQERLYLALHSLNELLTKAKM